MPTAFRDIKVGYGALPFVDTPVRIGTPRTSTKLVEAAGWPVRTGVRIPPPPEHPIVVVPRMRIRIAGVFVDSEKTHGTIDGRPSVDRWIHRRYLHFIAVL